MKDMSLQSSMSLMMPPPAGGEVLTFLSAACRALGGRSDADLARTIGVKPHIIANWRRRQAVPTEYNPWFSTTLAEKIGTYNRELPQVSLEARAAVVQLITRTGGDPIRAGTSASIAAGLALGGLLALAQFLVDIGDSWETDALTDHLTLLMPSFRHADQLRAAIA